MITKNKNLLLTLVAVIVLVAIYQLGSISGWWTPRQSQDLSPDGYQKYSLEPEDPNTVLRSGQPRKSLYGVTSQGAKKIIIEDITLLKNYPGNEIAAEGGFGLKQLAYSIKNGKMVFVSQPLGGGVFYSRVYILDLKNLENGFQKIDNFFTAPGLVKQAKIIGVGTENNKLFLINLDKDYFVPTLVYQSPPGKTFLFPSFYGADDVHVAWKDSQTTEIKEYDESALKMINPGDPNTYPKPQIKIVTVP